MRGSITAILNEAHVVSRRFESQDNPAERGDEQAAKITGLTALSLVLQWIAKKHPPVTGQTKFEVFLSTFPGEPMTIVVVSKKRFFSLEIVYPRSMCVMFDIIN